MIQYICGETVDKYLDKKVFSPMGIEFNWLKDDDGNAYGVNGLNINADNLCKIGIMLLNGGTYDNKKIMESKSVDEFLNKQVDHIMMGVEDEGRGYGYCLWFRGDWIFMYGLFGEFLALNKKKNIIGCRLIKTHWEHPEFEKYTFDNLMYFNDFTDVLDSIENIDDK